MTDFSDKYNDFNADYFPMIQILGKPDPDRDITLIGGGSREYTPKNIEKKTEVSSILEGLKIPGKGLGASALKERFAKAVKYITEQARYNQMTAWERIVAMSTQLWTAHPMHGAEYEGGGFESCIVAGAIEGSLVCQKIEVEASTQLFPTTNTLSYQQANGISETLQREWKNAHNIELKDSIATDVYIIAPEKHLKAARSLIRSYLAGSYGVVQELDSHRGIGFSAAVAYQSLNDEDQAKIDDAFDGVGWYDLYSRVFFTIDKGMFENVKTALNASDPDNVSIKSTPDNQPKANLS